MAAKLPCHIRIVEARDLKAADVHGTSDPLVMLSLKGLLKKKHRSSTITNTVNPIWNEDFVLEPHHPDKDVIVIKVYDRDIGKNDLLGMVRLPVLNYFNRGPIDEWRPLLTRTGQPARGDIHIQLNWGTGPIAHALSDSSSMMTNRQAYGEPATAHNPLDRNGDGRVDVHDLTGQPGNQQVLGQQGLGLGQPGYGQPGYAQQGLGQQGLGQTASHNPLDRNGDGRVNLQDVTGRPGNQQVLGQQGLGQPGYGQQGLGQTASHNPLDRNGDGRVNLQDLTGRPGNQQVLGQQGLGQQGLTTQGAGFTKVQPGGQQIGQATGYTTTTTTISHH